MLDAFLETLGENGTLVLPTLCKYDWKQFGDSAIERCWHIDHTPAFTGILAETLRKRGGSLRSNHPTHSVVGHGKLATEITCGHSTGESAPWCDNPNRPRWLAAGAFGSHSPWHKLCQHNAKYMFIGVDFNCATLFHHVQVKLLENLPPDQARRAPWPQFDFLQLGRALESQGLVQTDVIGRAKVKIIGSRTLVENSLRLLTLVGHVPIVKTGGDHRQGENHVADLHNHTA